MTTTAPTIQDRTSQASALISEWAAEPPQTLVPRKLVIDRLLDLRNMVTASRRADVDAILADVPGVTVVEGRWWAAQLATLAIGLDAHAAGEPR
ncbi:MAG: hypothetical protein ACE367_00050 [Acidimicrobiales bacterium]